MTELCHAPLTSALTIFQPAEPGWSAQSNLSVLINFIQTETFKMTKYLLQSSVYPRREGNISNGFDLALRQHLVT